MANWSLESVLPSRMFFDRSRPGSDSRVSSSNGVAHPLCSVFRIPEPALGGAGSLSRQCYTWLGRVALGGSYRKNWATSTRSVSGLRVGKHLVFIATAEDVVSQRVPHRMLRDSSMYDTLGMRLTKSQSGNQLFSKEVRIATFREDRQRGHAGLPIVY